MKNTIEKDKQMLPQDFIELYGFQVGIEYSGYLLSEIGILNSKEIDNVATYTFSLKYNLENFQYTTIEDLYDEHENFNQHIIREDGREFLCTLERKRMKKNPDGTFLIHLFGVKKRIFQI